jgi:hypothetical protein
VDATGDGRDRDGGKEELLRGEGYRDGGEIGMMTRKNRGNGVPI